MNALHSTKAASLQAFASWHKGRRDYVIWVYFLDHLKDTCTQLQEQLSSHISFYPNQRPHITLGFSGFLVENKTKNDEITLKEIQQIANQLNNLPKASLDFFALDSFPHCPYIACRDKSSTNKQIRKQLNMTEPFTPHLTLGTYLEEKPFSELKDFFTQKIQLNAQVDKLYCVKYTARPISKQIPVCPEDFTILETISLGKAD